MLLALCPLARPWFTLLLLCRWLSQGAEGAAKEHGLEEGEEVEVEGTVESAVAGRRRCSRCGAGAVCRVRGRAG